MTPYTLINDSSPERRNTHTHTEIIMRHPDVFLRDEKISFMFGTIFARYAHFTLVNLFSINTYVYYNASHDLGRNLLISLK